MKEVKPERFGTFPFLNKPLFIKGMDVGQMSKAIGVAFFLPAILIFKYQQFMLCFILLGLEAIYIANRFKDVVKKNKKGDPDPMASSTSWKRQKKLFVDDCNIIEMLEENGK